VVRTAAFLHDIAKPVTLTRETLADGTVMGHFYGHERRSADLARGILERLKFPSAEGFPRDGIDAVYDLIEHHLVPAEAFATDRSLRRWVRRIGGRDNARRLLVLRDADRAGHAAGLDTDEAARFRARLAGVDDVPLSQHSLALSGADIADRFGLSGADIGRLKESLLEQVVAGDVPNEPGALLEAARAILNSDV
jgi:tRNA nucleotidyltransferase (CCA-adding enzyme)